MKKFIALVLSLVMALSLCVPAWGATTHEVSTEDQLAELLDEDGTNDVAEGDTIKLLNNIQVQNAMHTSGTSANGVSYTGGKSFTIDFNNFSVSAGNSINNAVFRIKTSGTVTLMNGTITASDVYYGVLANGTGTINLDNMTISLTNTGGQGVAVNAYAGTVNVNDGTEITATGAYAGMEVYGTANIYEGSTVSYVGNVPTPNTYGSIGSAVGTSGGGTLNIYGGELVSTATGGNTVATNSSGGTINITGGTITGETAVFALTDSYYNAPAEINISGGTINGALAETAYGTASTEVTVSGGVFDTDVNAYLATGYETAEVGSTGGTFVVGQDIEVDAGKITAGTFTDDVSAYVAAGHTFATDVNGNLVVLAGTNVPASAAKGAYYTTDMTTLAVYPGCDLTNYKYALEHYTNGAAAAKTFDQKVIWKTDKVTGAKTIDGVYVVAASSESADLAFVNGSQITYLSNVAAYTGTVTALPTVDAKDAAKCGDMFVGGDYAAYTDANAKMYVEKAGGTVYNAGGKYVELVEVTPNTTYIVDTLLVNPAGYAPYTLYIVSHEYGVDYKTVATKTEVTNVYCKECKATFAFVEGTKADAVKKFGAGNYIDFGAGLFVAKVANGSVVTPSTDKVTSAETFDAGIAMYVGMSVMAAAGSAVVLKKKD